MTLGIPLKACGVAVLLLAAGFAVDSFNENEPSGSIVVSEKAKSGDRDSLERRQISHSTSPLERLPQLPPPVLQKAGLSLSASDRWIFERSEELKKLSWFDDPDSLSLILTELQNPVQEIRQVALAAVRSFGDRKAIPYLKAAAVESSDPAEIMEIGKLILHLELPTLQERLREKPNDFTESAELPQLE